MIVYGGATPAEVSSPPSPIRYEAAEHLCDLDCRSIHESSGLAISRRDKNILWTHNDSGNAAILYAFNLQGKLVSQCKVADILPHDWEDMASLVWNDKPYLLVGDVGDNQRRRKDYVLHLIPEPSLDDTNVRVEQSIHFTFAGGPQDCESVGFDPDSRTILLACKAWTPSCAVFALPWPTTDDDPTIRAAQPIANLSLGGISGMDVTNDGLRAILISYTDAFEVVRSRGESWAAALRRKPRQLTMPTRKQGESICYGQDNATLFLTSEKSPTPLFRVAPTQRVGPATRLEP